jgi:hypothetical protein
MLLTKEAGQEAGILLTSSIPVAKSMGPSQLTYHAGGGCHAQAQAAATMIQTIQWVLVYSRITQQGSAVLPSRTQWAYQPCHGPPNRDRAFGE